MTISAVSLLLALLVLEVVLRTALPVPSYRRHAQYDPLLGFAGISGYTRMRSDHRGSYPVTHNSLGFRGPELPATGAARGEARRLLFIGDSFLKAARVREEERIAEVTAELLNARGIPTEQFGLSMEGYGTGQELLLWRRFGRALRPDLVVLVFYTGNDPLNDTLSLAGATLGSIDYDRPYLLVDSGGGTTVGHLHPVRALLRRHLRSFAHLELALIARHQAGLPFGIDPRTEWRAEAWRAEGESPGKLELNPYELLRPEPSDERFEQAWEASEALLAAFHREVEAAGSRLLVVVVPLRAQVQRDAQSAFVDALMEGRLDELIDWELPERRLRACFEREGIGAIFAVDAMRTALRGGLGDLYGQDNHLLPAGCRVVAERVAAWVSAGAQAGSIDPVEPGPPGPVDVLPLEREWAVTDFRTRAHLERVAVRGARWRPESSAGKGGWQVQDRLRTALPARAGELVVRGVVPEPCLAESLVTVEVHELGSTRARVTAAGELELRVPGLEPRGDADLLLIELTRTAPGSAAAPPGSLIVQEVGLLPARGRLER